MTDALTSKYIIDGVPQEFTPSELLGVKAAQDTGIIVDETVDPALESHEWDPRKVDFYYDRIVKSRRRLLLPYSDVYTRSRMAESLIDAIWLQGHFCLDDLALKAEWKWRPGPVGSQAAFYRSVQAASDFSDALGLSIKSFGYSGNARWCDVSFKTVVDSGNSEDDEFSDSSEKVFMKTSPVCPGMLQPDSSSWLVYIPFDCSDYRLGGSLLAQALNFGGGISPQIKDADYFIDCYEVVRELVEDGVVLSGVTVGDGGLLKAARRLCAGGPGVTLDISDALKAFEESNAVRVLFSEIPGVLIQVRDIDFDYVDAEFLLQDVAFFPLGHPNLRSSSVRIRASEKSGIQTILESLMQQKAEGED